MNRPAAVCVLAGIVPVIAVHLAFGINVSAGFEACNPYIEGCASVSRAIRSGPGLWLFKIAAIPSAMLMWAAWSAVQNARGLVDSSKARTFVIRAGKTGAVFFLVYAVWLGTDGEVYKWLRRYGVVFYFGLTGLAHLVLASGIQRKRKSAGSGLPKGPMIYIATVLLAWAVGVSSAFKRTLFEDEYVLNRVENMLEWSFALVLSLCFVSMLTLFRPAQGDAASQRSDSGQR